MNAPDIRHFMFFPNSHWIAEFCHSGRILQMRKAIKKIKVMTSKGLITKRPDNYARMIVIPRHCFCKMTEITVCFLRIALCIGQCPCNKCQCQFILHINSMLITLVKKIFAWRIMGGSDIVAVCFFKQCYILFNQLIGQCTSISWTDFMAAHTA